MSGRGSLAFPGRETEHQTARFGRTGPISPVRPPRNRGMSPGRIIFYRILPAGTGEVRAQKSVSAPPGSEPATTGVEALLASGLVNPVV